VREILETPSETTVASNQELVTPINGNILVENLSFSYPGRPDLQILNNISFEVKQGSKIALVGASGSGKTTMFALLQRWYNYEQGLISIDNKDIKDFDLFSLRSQIGVVPQDVFLFGGTIRENIQYGKPNASDEEIIEAAIQANAWHYIEQFPEKLDTIVGERGIKLSGGQRQRIAIARAILKNPKILLLDEATSALDAESEKIVQEALERLMVGRTSIIIAHRLATIRNVDKIIVISKGKIEEQGTHEELIQLDNGIYRSLARLQFND
jgi:ABC-type multidrug transport system fused ATPase/permease subunit